MASDLLAFRKRFNLSVLAFSFSVFGLHCLDRLCWRWCCIVIPSMITLFHEYFSFLDLDGTIYPGATPRIMLGSLMVSEGT